MASELHDDDARQISATAAAQPVVPSYPSYPSFPSSAMSPQYRISPRPCASISTDHKVIGLQYALTSLVFLLVGFLFILLIRWHLAWPTQPIPLIGALLGEARSADGVLLPEFYLQLGAMHGTTMVFLAVVPLAVGAFGNYLIPLMVGAPDMAFPRLNALSYWLYFVAGLVMMAGFFLPGGAASSGWTSYPPLADIATTGQTAWLVGHVPARAVVDAQFDQHHRHDPAVARARPDADAAAVLRVGDARDVVPALDRVPAAAGRRRSAIDGSARRHELLPADGLMVSGKALTATGGGSPILWQHLFWFLGHPEVYVLILPALGIVAEVIANITRKPLWGYRAMVGCRARHGHAVVSGVGAPHVPHRHGPDDERILPGHDDDHFDPVGDHRVGARAVALRRIDPLHRSGTVRAGIPADVWSRRPDRTAARPGRHRHSAARHLLRDRSLPLHRRARHDVRAVCRYLLLVSRKSPAGR